MTKLSTHTRTELADHSSFSTVDFADTRLAA
jgi:hypothetical protein